MSNIKLYNGDCVEILKDLELDNVCIVTDPPFNISYHYGEYEDNLPDGDYIIRKLTPIECERLQTVPDNYTEYGLKDSKKVKIPNSARYKALGNGWTVDVISYILSFLV